MRRAMMKCLHVAVAVLSLLSVGQSAPVSSCESLIQPIEINGKETLLGRWTYIGEGTNIPASKLLTKMLVESATARISATNDSDTITVFQTQKMFGRCFTLTSHMTLSNNSLSVVHPLPGSAVLLSTGCPDCLVIYSNYTIGLQPYSGLQLMSRRTEVTAAELEEFNKQIECLNLPAPAILDPAKGFCPDESPSQETDAIDLTNDMKRMGPELFNQFVRILNNEGGLQKMLKLLSSGVAGLKED